MRKNIVIVVLCFFSFTVFSQEKNQIYFGFTYYKYILQKFSVIHDIDEFVKVNDNRFILKPSTRKFQYQSGLESNFRFQIAYQNEILKWNKASLSVGFLTQFNKFNFYVHSLYEQDSSIIIHSPLVIKNSIIGSSTGGFPCTNFLYKPSKLKDLEGEPTTQVNFYIPIVLNYTFNKKISGFMTLAPGAPVLQRAKIQQYEVVKSVVVFNSNEVTCTVCKVEKTINKKNFANLLLQAQLGGEYKLTKHMAVGLSVNYDLRNTYGLKLDKIYSIPSKSLGISSNIIVSF